jgi:monovalent cation:H+ antiporter, CPA1 family
MEISIESVLALFSFLTVSSGVYLLSRKIKIPYSVLLVIAGLVLVPLSQIGVFSFIREFSLTPELLFYIILPILIFESGYGMNARKIFENITSISLLSIVSFLVSAVVVALGIWWVLGLIGYGIPFIFALLFGALISSTDPVAVLALFKEYGAPRRLALIFEGESLFNDGTSYALFLIVLGVALEGFHGSLSIIEGVLMFTTMIAGGCLIGLFTGWLFAKLIGFARASDAVSITLTIALAHLTFIGSELISSHLHLFGQDIKISSIIATSIASIVMGNYGRYKLSPKITEFVEQFWGQFAFLANSLVFLLLGLLFVQIEISLWVFIFPILVAIAVVMVARAVSIYPIVAFLNLIKVEENIPRPWQHLLAWGSLRGALAITMVLLIPESLAFEGWQYAFTPKDFLLALTIGCIFFTLFVKALTIGPLIKRLKIDRFSALEELEKAETLVLIYTTVLKRIKGLNEKGYIDADTYRELDTKYNSLLTESLSECGTLHKHTDPRLFARILRLYAIGIEKYSLRQLYAYGEISERAMRRVTIKLELQREQAERGSEEQAIRLADLPMGLQVFHRLQEKLVPSVEIGERYMYYRAQAIIARKVVKELMTLLESEHKEIFNSEAINKTIALYKGFREGSLAKMNEVLEANPELVKKINKDLAQRSVLTVESVMLHKFADEEFITPKVNVSLRDMFEQIS